MDRNTIENNIPFGYCHCGCGQKTRIAAWNNKRANYKKGEPLKFIHRHKTRPRTGDGRESSLLNGKKCLLYQKQITNILGFDLPAGTIIHHVDGNCHNNNNNNLVVCQDRSYHALLHIRTKALRECGNANFRYCGYCGKWDDPQNMYSPPKRNTAYHKECHAHYMKAWRKNKKEKNCDD
jgi:hypothetical protein